MLPNKICYIQIMDVSKLRLVKQLFIGGRFVNSIKGRTFDVINPND